MYTHTHATDERHRRLESLCRPLRLTLPRPCALDMHSAAAAVHRLATRRPETVLANLNRDFVKSFTHRLTI